MKKKVLKPGGAQEQTPLGSADLHRSQPLSQLWSAFLSWRCCQLPFQLLLWFIALRMGGLERHGSRAVSELSSVFSVSVCELSIMA